MRYILFLYSASAAFAQSVEFDVASVKPTASSTMDKRPPIPGPIAEIFGFEGGPGSKTPGKIHYTGVSMKMILVKAYGVRPYQISAPGWMDTEHYDIDAKYPAETSPEDFRLMLQKLLAERFHLALHSETREVSRYKLVVAKGGPKLSPVQKQPEYKDDEERQAAMMKQRKERMDAMMRKPRSGPSQSFRNSSITMAKLAENLSTYVGRPVADETGIEGSYSLSLEWSPNDSLTAVDTPLPPLLTAIQEQLGLKLEPDKGPVAFLVIERADKTPAVN